MYMLFYVRIHRTKDDLIKLTDARLAHKRALIVKAAAAAATAATATSCTTNSMPLSGCCRAPQGRKYVRRARASQAQALAYMQITWCYFS